MEPIELFNKCKSALENGLDNILLVLPRKAGKGERMVVFNKPRVYGELVSENSKGKAIVAVKAIDMLAYLCAAGVVEISYSDGNVTVSMKDPDNATCEM